MIPASMDILESLSFLAEETLNEANDWYHWREINESKIPIKITLPKGNQYLRNIVLKEELHKAWMLEPDPIKKAEIIKYYITAWGGIHTNSKDSLDNYIYNSPEVLIGFGKKGIASWSKALVIHNPKKYAIFDARVSLSLNCLQIISKVDRKELYPLLSSRNRTIKEGNKIIEIRSSQEEWNEVDNKIFYNDYLGLLQEISVLRNTNISTLEMLLFTKAIAFVEEIKNFV